MSNRDEDLKLENVSCMAVGDVDGDGDNDVFMAQYRQLMKKGRCLFLTLIQMTVIPLGC